MAGVYLVAGVYLMAGVYITAGIYKLSRMTDWSGWSG